MAGRIMVIDTLLARAESRPLRTAFSFAQRDEIRSTLTFGDLACKGLIAAGALSRAGLRRGERVLVCLPTSEDLLVAIFGVLLAGGVCVPMYPLSVGQGLDRWRKQVAAIVRVSQPRGAVVVSQSKAAMAATFAERREQTFILDPGQLRDGPPVGACTSSGSDLALVQFTSGTTREPRGVAISHGALSANVNAIIKALDLNEDVVSVSWLPPYHDMGLVGHVFTPMVCGAHQVLMPPSHFLIRPLCWLQLISKLKATQTTAPNTGYSMCVHRIPPEARSGLDLSHLRQALVGAEPVLPETLNAFAQAFGPAGFRPEAFRPVYGLAEATLAVAFGPVGGAVVDWVSRQAISDKGCARPERANGSSTRGVVCVGAAVPDHDVRVVDDSGGPCAPRVVGEILFRGPSLMDSYFNNPQASCEVKEDGWLRTGDLGYLVDGRLYVTGRNKELVIKAGRNHVPSDLEAACERDPAVRRGRVVAFGLPNSETGTEDIVVVAEARHRRWVNSAQVAQRLTALVVEHAGIRPDRVDIVAAGVLSKTSSGKLQRARVRTAYQAGLPLLSNSAGGWLGHPTFEMLRGKAWALAEIGRCKAREWLNWR